MSQCGRTHLLDALSARELSSPIEAELRTHARQCARCRHELNWLESERRLFRHRAGRDEVAALWQGVEARAPLTRSPTFNRLLVALAAVLFVVLGVSRRTFTSPADVEPSTPMMTVSSDALAPQSVDELGVFESSEDAPACSQLTPGLGFHCGSVQSSVLASR